jgi:tripartite-type tricarboxylate transporter receptor subunit TctC
MTYKQCVVQKRAAAEVNVALSATRTCKQPVALKQDNGSADSVGRQIANSFSKILGQSVIVENKLGANANLATDYVRRSAPDGYTLFYTSIGHVMNAEADLPNYDMSTWAWTRGTPHLKISHYLFRVSQTSGARS